MFTEFGATLLYQRSATDEPVALPKPQGIAVLARPQSTGVAGDRLVVFDEGRRRAVTYARAPRVFLAGVAARVPDGVTGVCPLRNGLVALSNRNGGTLLRLSLTGKVERVTPLDQLDRRGGVERLAFPLRVTCGVAGRLLIGSSISRDIAAYDDGGHRLWQTSLPGFREAPITSGPLGITRRTTADGFDHILGIWPLGADWILVQTSRHHPGRSDDARDPLLTYVLRGRDGTIAGRQTDLPQVLGVHTGRLLVARGERSGRTTNATSLFWVVYHVVNQPRP